MIYNYIFTFLFPKASYFLRRWMTKYYAKHHQFFNIYVYVKLVGPLVKDLTWTCTLINSESDLKMATFV